MMTLMVIISLIGVFTPETAGVWEPDEKMNTANVAWMITATIFVLMMTPGLPFFMEVWLEEKRNFYYSSEFYCNGYYQRYLGGIRIQPCFW